MMPFPFTESEWEAVSETARHVLNASFARNPRLQTSWFRKLKGTLAQLRMRYGEHPVLLETEADFTQDTSRSLALYQRAIEIALAHHLQTLTIRLSLARLLLSQLDQPTKAREELLACQNERDASADEWNRQEWSDLLAECEPRRATKENLP